jgi:hypothetical protein
MKPKVIASTGVLVMTSLLLFGGSQSSVKPAFAKVRSWTTHLRDTQPEDAFAAVYARGTQYLIFVAAKHSIRSNSLTFRLIGDAYASFRVNTAIVEGPPYSRGANADRLIKWIDAQRETDGSIEAGEIVPAVRGAQTQKAAVFGGEPDDAYLRDHVLAKGFSKQDILGFYTLRSIPQWVGEQKINGAGDDRVKPLVKAELEHNRERLSLPSTVLPDFAAWAEWYAQTNQKAFGAAFDPEEVGPLADGHYGSNKIAEAISHVRDEFLLNTIAQHWNEDESIIVVFGASHLMILRPALDSMLGDPCYQGSDLKSASAPCSPKTSKS